MFSNTKRTQIVLSLMFALILLRLCLGQVFAQGVPHIIVKPTTLDFGSPVVGERVTQTLTVSNSGTAALFILFNLGLPAPPFSVPPEVVGGFKILPNDEQTIPVTFRSQDLADHNDALKLDHNDPNAAMISVPLHGRAQGGPNIVAEPTALSFGDVTVEHSGFRTLTVRNTGTSDLTVSALSSTNALQFSVIAPTTVPFTVTPDATPFPVTVLFSPTFDGVHTGRLDITSNDPDLATVPITLHGTGRGGVPNFAEGQGGLLDFGSVCVGGSVARQLTVSNTGTGTLIVTAINLTPSFRVIEPGVPFGVPPHASPVTVTIHYSPNTPGPTLNAGVSIFSNDPDLPFANRVFLGAGRPRGTTCNGICCEEHECGGCRPGFCIKPPQQCK
jgi:hypothetical protein